MHRTDTSLSHQQNRITDYRNTSDSVGLFNVLTSDSLLDKVEELLPKHRERLYPPTETLSMFLSQAMSSDRSCQNSVNKSVVHRVGDGLSICSTKTGGYCRARQRLPKEMVSELTCHLGSMIDEQTTELWRWKKRRIRIVDGTTVTMPDTPRNQAVYPQQKGQREGVGFPICRVVGITYLSSGALLNAAIGPFKGKGGDEQTLVRSIQDSFEPGDILMADAYYASYFFIADMQAKGVDILMEQYVHVANRLTLRKEKGLVQKTILLK